MIVMRTLRGRGALLGTACAIVAAGVAAVLVLFSSTSSQAEPTKAEYFVQVADICRVYGPQLDKIRPPDVAEPANVIEAVERVLPLITAQERKVKALAAPPELQSKLARWFRLQDRRIGMLERALQGARRQDFRALSVAYVDFLLAAPETARLGSEIGIPHPPC